MENEIYVKVLIPHCDCGEEYREYPTKIIVTKEENGYGIWFEYCPGGEDHDTYLMGWNRDKNRALEIGVFLGQKPLQDIITYAVSKALLVN